MEPATFVEKPETQMIRRPKFCFADFLTEEFKHNSLNSDSLFVPIIVEEPLSQVSDGDDEDDPEPAFEPATGLNQRFRQNFFLVHLQVRKMSVTVYTSKEYGAEDGRQHFNSDNDNEEMAVAEDQNESGSNNSDELGDDCDEFTIAQPTTASTTHEA